MGRIVRFSRAEGSGSHLTKNGHLQKHYYKEYERPQDVHGGYLKYYHYGDKKNDVRLTRVILDQNRNPVFVKEEYDKRDTIFRISGDSIYLTKDENMYGHFLIEY
ncbi:MAG: hypothetical protein IPM77_08365 [Crocinitomicaceae bacterium]|nr:hypothetical protein [Crocinitomicaceae bacterium]